MNTELFERIKEEIMKDPLKFNMSVWHCGTAYCIGGWACHLSNVYVPNWDRGLDVQETAMKLLDIDDPSILFENEWPSDLKEKFKDAQRHRDFKKEAEVACFAIDRFMTCDWQGETE